MLNSGDNLAGAVSFYGQLRPGPDFERSRISSHRYEEARGFRTRFTKLATLALGLIGTCCAGGAKWLRLVRGAACLGVIVGKRKLRRQMTHHDAL